LIKFIQIYQKNIIKLIPFLLEGVALKPEFNLSDGMHPNEKGTIIISNTLKKAILNKL
jgi:acyl-CoA thioesterase-1